MKKRVVVLILLMAIKLQAAPQAVMYDPATGQYIITGVSTSANLSALTGTFTNPTVESTSVTNWFQKTGAASWGARCLFGSVVFSNKIWVIGGGTGGGSSDYDDTWSSPDGTNWTQEATGQSWGPRSEFACVVHSNRVWILGGYFNNAKTNDVWSSTNGATWTQVTNAADWTVRCGLAGVVYSNKLWIMGGIDSSLSQKNDVWNSIDGSNWTQVTSGAAWGIRYYHSVVVFDGKMWVIGGLSDSACYNDVWYSTDGVNWTQATGDAGWETRYRMGAVSNAGKMYVYGGYVDVGGGNSWRTNDMWSSTDGASWTEVTNSCGWSKRYGMGCSAFDNKMWAIGGYDGSALNDVWYYGASLSYPAGSFDGSNVIWNVGLGAKLFLYQNLTTAPVPTKGAVYFNSASNIFYRCTNGTSWTAF